MTGATIQCLGHSANPAIKFGAGRVNRTLVGEVQALCTATVLDQQTLELARSLELRSGAYRAPALPVELYQRSWRGDSNADHGLTRPALFPLSYTSKETSGGGGENCTPACLLCRQMPCCLGYTAAKIGAEGGTRTRALDVGNVASLPLDDFRLERAVRVESTSSAWKAEAPAAIPCSLFTSGRGDRIRTCLNSFWRRAPFPSGHHPCGGRNGS